MVTKKVMIKNVNGIHARPASNLVREASKYEAKIELVYHGRKARADSIFSVMALGVHSGDAIEISAEGPDEKTAAEELAKFVNSGCGE